METEVGRMMIVLMGMAFLCIVGLHAAGNRKYCEEHGCRFDLL